MAIWIQFSDLPANTEKTMMRALIKLFLNILIFLVFYVNYRSNLCRKVLQAEVFVDLVQELSESALKFKVFHDSLIGFAVHGHIPLGSLPFFFLTE